MKVPMLMLEYPDEQHIGTWWSWSAHASFDEVSQLDLVIDVSKVVILDVEGPAQMQSSLWAGWEMTQHHTGWKHHWSRWWQSTAWQEKADAWWCPSCESWWRDTCPCWSWSCWEWWCCFHVCCLLEVGDVDWSGMCSRTWMTDWWSSVWRRCWPCLPLVCWQMGHHDRKGWCVRLCSSTSDGDGCTGLFNDRGRRASMLISSSWKSWSVLRMLCWMKEIHWGKMYSPVETRMASKSSLLFSMMRSVVFPLPWIFGLCLLMFMVMLLLRMSASPSSGLLTLVM